MAVSDSDIVKLRQMTAEIDSDTFSDAELAQIIEEYPLTEGYDLNAAAAEVWGLKAAIAAMSEESVTVDGSRFDFGQLTEKALKMHDYYSRQAETQYSKYGSGSYLRDDVSEEVTAE